MSSTSRGFTFISGDFTDFLSFAELKAAGEDFGRRLASAGFQRGDRGILMLSGQREFIVAFIGMVRAGVIPVPVFPPAMLTRIEAYRERLLSIHSSCEPRHIIADETLFDICVEAVGAKPVSYAELAAGEPTGELVEAEGGEPLFLQYTSGSTASPKGVVVTHDNLLENARAMDEALGTSGERDRFVSWLPLYHDMGLIGCMLGPLVYEVPVWFIPPYEFARRPTTWLDWMSRVKSTFSYAPNFAYELVTRRATDKQMADWDLSAWRVAGVGAEPVRPRTMREFGERFASAGFDAKAITPSYGMAEATLGVAFTTIGEGLRTLSVDAAALSEQGVVRPVDAGPGAEETGTREIVSCGPLLSGWDIRIRAASGELAEESAGEFTEGQIEIRGGSVARGYWGAPELTEEAFQDGWLRTGDLGFLREGELYVTGRTKDLVIHHGRKYHPTDIEWAALGLPGIRPDHVIAFSTPDERLVVVAEHKPASSPPDLAKQIATRVRGSVGVTPDDVVLVKPGTLPKTSSGKLRRAACRDAYANNALAGHGGAH
ncbi:fatty acyl-AMP ligase [Streptomyces sp. ME19-01-6]|uniref:fatty acyl-AMP ligase n=1 Tax=Streptomyces sp. ME19-01-6 TaxID=3028686 RepID=UPI0029B94486|nr:fatty acyl-AMP ligase [Streptomyces sp. ME19-01-6]MDX3231337.1 fatty acyl-AMP ligase [Streptomyces sp. ME19-01-6]